MAVTQLEALYAQHRQRLACIDQASALSNPLYAILPSSLPFLAKYPQELEAVILKQTLKMEELQIGLKSTILELEQIVKNIQGLYLNLGGGLGGKIKGEERHPASLSLTEVATWLYAQAQQHQTLMARRVSILKKLDDSNFSDILEEWKSLEDPIDYRQQVTMMERLKLFTLMKHC